MKKWWCSIPVHLNCMFVRAPPETFLQWSSPSLGLCSRELFGGPRKFSFTLHDNFVWQKEGRIFLFVIAWFARHSRCRRTSRAQYLGRGAHLESQRRKEGRKASVSRLSLWCRRCGTAPCPTPARIPTKSGSKRIIKGKDPHYRSVCHNGCQQARSSLFQARKMANQLANIS